MSIEEDEDIPYKDSDLGNGYIMRREWIKGCAVFKGEQRVTGWWYTDEDVAGMFAQLHRDYEKLANPPTEG